MGDIDRLCAMEPRLCLKSGSRTWDRYIKRTPFKLLSYRGSFAIATFLIMPVTDVWPVGGVLCFPTSCSSFCLFVICTSATLLLPGVL